LGYKPRGKTYPRDSDVFVGRIEDGLTKEIVEAYGKGIKALAASGEGFCSDDLRREAGDPPCDHHLIGAVMQGAIKRGLIKQVSTTRSGRLIGHGNKVGVYVGVSVNWP
jgi:hypothetical protein